MARGEFFGPAPTVHGYADVDEAVANANGARPDMSGLGREWGVAGMRAFQEVGHISAGSR